jgi:uncharacterized protein DUF5926/SEC-C motif-containing protein
VAKRRRSTHSATVGTPLPEGTGPVAPRDPCPCGSGERYKNCHGRAERARVGLRNPRPFAGLPFERDLVALREFVPSATAPVTLAQGQPFADVLVCSLLPMARPALARADGTLWLGLQLQNPTSLDPARDLVAAVRGAAGLPAGSMLDDVPAWSEDDPTPVELFGDSTFEVTVHEGLDWWLEGQDVDGEMTASLERANASVYPTAKLAGVEAAYWCQIGDKAHIRWVTDFPEDRLLAALARLQAAGAAGVGEGSRLVGSFRTHGLVVPVWDLRSGTQPDEVQEPMTALAARLDEAMAVKSPLDSDELRSLALLNSRQVTLR